MKIAHIITGLDGGGAEGVLYRLVTHDKQNQHVIVSMMDKGKYGSLLLDQVFEVYCLNMKPGKIMSQDIAKLYQFLKTAKPDVVQTWMYHADFLGRLAAKFLVIKKFEV